MPDGQWEKAKAVFLAAIEQPAVARSEFVAEGCLGDAALLEEVESLLVSHFECEDFIEEPAGSLLGNGSLLAGKQFGRYTIVREIGHGGMGTVFLAERTDGEFKQRVALKLMRPGMATAEVRRRFLHERQILAGLEHPYIARLIDGGTTDDGVPFIVMEYVDGMPITQYAVSLALNERLRLFQKVCDAVSYAHRSLVIHRDLKPSNILVTPDGSPKLLDFGIAKLLDTDAGHTMTDLAAFTPDYASPEQLDGRPITTASDVYGLGVLLYELLTERAPYRFKTHSPEEVLRVVREQPAVRPSSVAASESRGDRRLLAGDLDTITLHALRKEPERRYSSVEQFAADIDRYVGNMPVVAREDSVGYRTSRFVRRHRYGVAAAAVVILTLVLGIVTTAWQARVASRQRDAAEAERAKAERINKFLQEMLSYSNQSWTSSVSTGQKRDITINEMLDDIGPRLDTELADQPEMRSRIFYTIGSAYNSQGRYDMAEQYLRKALDLARPLYGETSTETMDILAALGETTFQTGRPDEGEKIYAELVDIMRRREATIENGKYRLAAALHGLGSERLMKGDAAGAIPVMRDAAATAAAAQLPGNERGLLAEIKLNLAGALIATGELNESETLLRESLAIFRELPGDPRWEMGVTLTRLGDCLVRKGEYAEGEAMLLEGEQIYLKTLGPSSHYLARNYNIRALAALAESEFLKAETKSRQSLDIVGKLSPQPETVRGRALFTLGIALCKTKRSSEGTQLLREALALYQRNNAAEANDVAISLLECSR